jgi:TfoX/Sxy family transcriptional regulator of competence genes
MPGKSIMKSNPWRKAPAELVGLFDEILNSAPGAERRVMFGFPVAFYQGNMFTGVHQDILFFRLGAEDLAKFLKLPGAAPFEPVQGHVMSQYVVVPRKMLKNKQELLLWLDRSFEYVRCLPPKVKKVKR